ncbi:MAG: hypothetical protein Q7S95_03610 [bacterium]|nr:hypothetical protein [bacterium]
MGPRFKIKKKRNVVLGLVASLVLLNAVLATIVLYGGQTVGHNSRGYPEIEQVRDQNMDFRQLSNFFKDLAIQKGGEYAYKALASAANMGYLSPNVDTHLLGHVVGDELFKQEGVNGIKICTNDLRNACSHSIVVGMLLTEGEESLPKIVATCKLAPGGSGAYTMCVHGLGHGILAYVSYDMRKATKLCEETNVTGREFSQCVGGEVMEMMAGVNDREAWAKQIGNYFKEDDPLSPCNMDFIPEEAKGMCYVYLTPHLFEAAGANLASPDQKYFKKAFGFCDKVPGEQDKNICYGGFGKEFIVLANARNVQSIALMSDEKLKRVYEWCIYANVESGIKACVNSALQSLYWGGENDRNASVRFCTLIADKRQQAFCMEDLISAVAMYVQDAPYRRGFCSELLQMYRADCRTKLEVAP